MLFLTMDGDVGFVACVVLICGATGVEIASSSGVLYFVCGLHLSCGRSDSSLNVLLSGCTGLLRSEWVIVTQALPAKVVISLLMDCLHSGLIDGLIPIVVLI